MTHALPADLSAVREARCVVRQVLDEWQAETIFDDVQLVASELVANAVRHGLSEDGQPATGVPAADRRTVRRPRGRLPGSGLPADGSPADPMPADALPVDGTSVFALPVDGLPVDGTSVFALPVDGLPVPGLPVDEPGQDESLLRISLVSTGSHVICAVTDPSGEPPVRRVADPLAGSGRGLQLVESLSLCWGWTALDGVGMTPSAAQGKSVWAIFPLDLPGRHRPIVGAA